MTERGEPPDWALPSWDAVPAESAVAGGRVSASVERLEEGIFAVRGKRIERLAHQTDFEVEESAARFQRDLARLGIDAQLRRAGIVPGDTVRIADVELEWEPQPWEEG